MLADCNLCEHCGTSARKVGASVSSAEQKDEVVDSEVCDAVVARIRCKIMGENCFASGNHCNNDVTDSSSFESSITALEM